MVTCIIGMTVDATDYTVNFVPNNGLIATDINTVGMSSNPNNIYLPIGLKDVFPNLSTYTAFNCNIMSISYANFEGLTEMFDLYLQNNLITSLDAGIFRDMTKLVSLKLSECSI